MFWWMFENEMQQIRLDSHLGLFKPYLCRVKIIASSLTAALTPSQFAGLFGEGWPSVSGREPAPLKCNSSEF